MDSLKKIGIIIQARMGSRRLPRKVLKNILGKPLLWHLIERLKKSRFANEIIVATTTKEIDISIEKLAHKCGVKSFAGKEKNVLDRFYRVAQKYNLDIIVRVCGDCPFLNYKIVDEAIKYYLSNETSFDYVCNFLPPTYPYGLDVEVFSAKTLERCWRYADTIRYKEHVTPFIYEHPNLFNIGSVGYKQNFSYLNFAVNTPDDLRFIRKIYAKLYRKNKDFSLEEILRLFKNEK